MPLCAPIASTHRDCRSTGSGFAYNRNKNQDYFERHPVLLINGSGPVEGLILAPARDREVSWLKALLDECLDEERAEALRGMTLLVRQRDAV